MVQAMGGYIMKTETGTQESFSRRHTTFKFWLSLKTLSKTASQFSNTWRL